LLSITDPEEHEPARQHQWTSVRDARFGCRGRENA